MSTRTSSLAFMTPSSENWEKVSALRVISRTSTLPYPGRDMLLPDIARELDVKVIIEGSVSGTGDSLRIQLQMIEVNPEDASRFLTTEETKYIHIFFGRSRISSP